MPASIKHLMDKKLNLAGMLARWKDGLYYKAAVVKCDKPNKRCLVCFEDGSEIWVNNRDVHIQLTVDQLNEDEDIVCCICDDGNSEPPNEIILCDVCQQGYHQKCHTPPVDSSKIDESEDASEHKDWFCATCSYILNQSDREKLSENAQKLQQPQKQQPSVTQPPQAPIPTPKPPTAAPAAPQGPQQKTRQQTTTNQSQQSSQQQSKIKQSTPIKAKPDPVPNIPVTKAATPAQDLPQQQTKTTVGPVKVSTIHNQKSAPYYPLSSQVRVAAATSSTAALASMTASSALVVGSSVGRTKQDLVNQSNQRSSQRQQQQQLQQQQLRQAGSNAEVTVKHAVRKSSVNFSMPVRQSALPTATRSVLPSTVQAAIISPSPLSVSHSTTASPAKIATRVASDSSTSPLSSAKPVTLQPVTQAPIIPIARPTINPIQFNSTSGNQATRDKHLIGHQQVMPAVNLAPFLLTTPKTSLYITPPPSSPSSSLSRPVATNKHVSDLGTSKDNRISYSSSTSSSSSSSTNIATLISSNGSGKTKIIPGSNTTSGSSSPSVDNTVSNSGEIGRPRPIASANPIVSADSNLAHHNNQTRDNNQR